MKLRGLDAIGAVVARFRLKLLGKPGVRAGLANILELVLSGTERQFVQRHAWIDFECHRNLRTVLRCKEH